MATKPSMVVNHHGNATILVDGEKTSFRFKISVTKELLQIWLEDRESKAQWQSKQLALDDFVTNENVLAQATMSDYAEQFAGILGSGDKAVDAIAGFTAVGTRTLELSFDLSAFSFAVRLAYQFELSPIALEMVDVLAAKMEDRKEAVKTMQTVLATLTQPVIAVDPHAADY